MLDITVIHKEEAGDIAALNTKREHNPDLDINSQPHVKPCP